MDTDKIEIIHIFVIGFHHKKGCQLEFSYPELNGLPDQWKTLPSLAMPDGAHNFNEDAVYFHLPSITSPGQTLFGISCFQQIPIEKVRNKTDDMTRGTVQKAVCVLSSVPLYGYIQVKMQLVTSAFFDGGDFSQTDILIEAFHHLNACLPSSSEQHLHDGLSVRDLLLRFRHRTLTLLKLLLLEKKIIFFHSPVEPLCTTLLSLLSLHPGLIEEGLFEAASASLSVDGSPSTPIHHSDLTTHSWACVSSEASSSLVGDNDTTVAPADFDKMNGPDIMQIENVHHVEQCMIEEKGLADEEAVDVLLIEDYIGDDSQRTITPKLRRGQSSEGVKSDISIGCDLAIISNVNLSSCGLPLALFGKGNYFFPYLSISYLDVLSSASVRGFLAGATNVLFKQKRQLSDVLIEVETTRIETQCPDLRKQLSLTTEDLRFMDQMLRGVTEPRNIEYDGIGKEGGESWIRAHFTLYLLSLLRTSLLQEGNRELDHFNQHFISSWRNTHNYKMWIGRENSGIWELNPGHPSAGSLSVNDVRLRLSQAMQSSESGRKLNQAVATTGRAVGGAITQAKGVLSGWWNNFTTPEGKSVKSIESI